MNSFSLVLFTKMRDSMGSWVFNEFSSFLGGNSFIYLFIHFLCFFVCLLWRGIAAFIDSILSPVDQLWFVCCVNHACLPAWQNLNGESNYDVLLSSATSKEKQKSQTCAVWWCSVVFILYFSNWLNITVKTISVIFFYKVALISISVV